MPEKMDVVFFAILVILIAFGMFIIPLALYRAYMIIFKIDKKLEELIKRGKRLGLNLKMVDGSYAVIVINGAEITIDHHMGAPHIRIEVFENFGKVRENITAGLKGLGSITSEGEIGEDYSYGQVDIHCSERDFEDALRRIKDAIAELIYRP